MPAKIAILYYSTYGHITKLAEQAAEGVKATGASVDILQIKETLPEEVLKVLHAPPKADHPLLEDVNKLKEYDGFLLGVPTRYGRTSAQVSSFFDQTGGLWLSGGLVGKFAGIFTSTASQHGGQETTALTTIPFFAHHGIVFVPIGYSSKSILGLDSVEGGSPYGASTIAAGDGSRQPSQLELDLAKHHGQYFSGIVNTFVAGKSA